MEHRDMLGKLAQSQGVVHQTIDQSVVNNTTNNIQHYQTVHNQVLHFVHTHQGQFGEYMRQQQLSQEQMMNLLYEHIRRTQPATVIHVMPP